MTLRAGGRSDGLEANMLGWRQTLGAGGRRAGLEVDATGCMHKEADAPVWRQTRQTVCKKGDMPGWRQTH